jgi:phospholipid-binding lipoprotein MlaA
MPTIVDGRPCRARLLPVLATFALAIPASTWAVDSPPDRTPHGDAMAEATGADYDPWQRMNRGIFWFNESVDHFLLEPVAKGWDFVTPEPVETSIANFFSNLRFPVVMVNNVLQGKLKPAAIDVGRFMVNSTFGIAGLFDPATIWGLPRHNEDFGQTLGWWGVPPGPYLVLPLLGPSNPRDTSGLPVDYCLSITPLFLSSFWWTGAGVINIVNARALVIEDVQQAREASLDYYVFVRNAYYQRRVALVNDQQEESGHPPTNDLYDINAINDEH